MEDSRAHGVRSALEAIRKSMDEGSSTSSQIPSSGPSLMCESCEGTTHRNAEMPCTNNMSLDGGMLQIFATVSSAKDVIKDVSYAALTYL